MSEYILSLLCFFGLLEIRLSQGYQQRERLQEHRRAQDYGRGERALLWSRRRHLCGLLLATAAVDVDAAAVQGNVPNARRLYTGCPMWLWLLTSNLFRCQQKVVHNQMVHPVNGISEISS